MNERKAFLARMTLEVMEAYEVPGEEWTPDEVELLPRFLSMLKNKPLLLDLAGGYGRITRVLLNHGHNVVLLDLSPHSLKKAKKELGENPKLDIVRADMLKMPLRSQAFNGAWFGQAFEYVPLEHRRRMLADIAKVLKKNGVLFVNAAHVWGECGPLRYILNYIYWRIIRKAPIRLGGYIYHLKLKHYKGWHYHSLIISRESFEKLLEEHYKTIDKRAFKTGYLAYILQKR